MLGRAWGTGRPGRSLHWNIPPNPCPARVRSCQGGGWGGWDSVPPAPTPVPHGTEGCWPAVLFVSFVRHLCPCAPLWALALSDNLNRALHGHASGECVFSCVSTCIQLAGLTLWPSSLCPGGTLTCKYLCPLCRFMASKLVTVACQLLTLRCGGEIGRLPAWACPPEDAGRSAAPSTCNLVRKRGKRLHALSYQLIG